MSDVRIRTKSSTSSPVNNVLMRIYSGSTFVTSGLSGEGANQSGERLFDLPTGDYTARFSMTGTAYQVVSPQAFTVSGVEADDVFLIVVDPVTRPVATDPNLCRCSGTVVGLDGSPLPNYSITVEGRIHPTLLDYNLVGSDRLRIVTDKKGYAQADLIRGAQLRVRVPGYEELSWVVKVPDTASANLPDVLFPVVSAVEFTPNVLTMSVGETRDIDAVVVYRSGLRVNVLTFDTTLPIYLDGTNNAVASFVYSPNGIKIMAHVAGTNTITALRAYEDPNWAITAVPALPGVEGSIVVTVA